MVANHAPSVPILSQLPSGSMSVNLAFQFSDKTLKSSYLYLLKGSLLAKKDEVAQLKQVRPMLVSRSENAQDLIAFVLLTCLYSFTELVLHSGYC